MAVLRLGDVVREGSGAIVLDLGDLTRQGDVLRARAKRDAEIILEQAARERARIIAGAREEGHATGLAEGRLEGHKQGLAEGRAAALAERRSHLTTLEQSWNAALAELTAGRERLLQDARADLVRLALTIATRVTRRTYEHDPAVVGALLAAALETISRPTRLVVRVNPEDDANAREALPALMATLTQVEHVDLRPDATLKRGSCVVSTTDGGEVDSSIGVQLDRISRALLPEAAP